MSKGVTGVKGGDGCGESCVTSVAAGLRTLQIRRKKPRHGDYRLTAPSRNAHPLIQIRRSQAEPLCRPEELAPQRHSSLDVRELAVDFQHAAILNGIPRLMRVTIRTC